MKLISLATIAAMRETADSYETQAKIARKAAYADKGNADANGIKAAEGFDLIARELRQIIGEKAHERAYSTARWITNANAGIRPADARAIAAAIEATPAVEEITAYDILPKDKGVGYRVRLVYYYDPTTQTKRWALEYTNDKDRPAISDNEYEADARYRYQEFIEMFGIAKGN